MNRPEALEMARESLQSTPAVHAVADLIMLIDPMKERIEKLESLIITMGYCDQRELCPACAQLLDATLDIIAP